MPRVILIGLEPTAVDFTDPDLPPGMNPEAIAAGIARTLSAMRDRGWTAEFCAILPDGTAEGAIAAGLAPGWDCAVIGGGIRIPHRNLHLFERVINAIGRHAPGTAIALNTSPDDTVDAAERWLQQAGKEV